MHAADGGTSGSPDGYEWQFVWDFWGRQVEPIGATMPYMVSVGYARRPHYASGPRTHAAFADTLVYAPAPQKPRMWVARSTVRSLTSPSQR